MKFPDKIRDESIRIAASLNSPLVLPRHLLLALITLGDDGSGLLSNEGIDPVGLKDVLTKYGKREGGQKGSPQVGPGAANILLRTEELAKGYNEEPEPEFFLWALSEDEEFLADELMQAIGINWDEVGRGMRRRIDARHALHPSWSQALIADPGLHKAGIHKSFSDGAKDILKLAFNAMKGKGGGQVGIMAILTALIEGDEAGQVEITLKGAGFDLAGMKANLGYTDNDLESSQAEGKVGFADTLVEALCEAMEQLRAFPAERVEWHHLLLGLLRVGEKIHPEFFGEYADMPYGPYQHVAVEIIHQRRGTPKLDLSQEVDPEAIKLLTQSQIQEFRAVPVMLDGGKLIVGTPGYLSRPVLERIEREVGMPVEARLVPGKWFREYAGL